MLRKVIPCCLSLLLCFGGLGYADGYSPKVGEILTYKVFVKSIFHGATQTVQVESKGTYNGQDVYYVHSEMMTVGLVKGLFNYYQAEDMILAAPGLYPLVIKQKIKDGDNLEQDDISFDYHCDKAVRFQTKNGGVPERSELILPGFVQDALSLQFFLRTDHVINNVTKIYFYANGIITDNSFNVSQLQQAIQLECGTFNKCFQIFDDVSKITVLITDTPERLPIVVKSTASFGTIEMKLARVQPGS